MAIFGPKPWVNPFEKILIFRLFKVFVFIVQKGVFSFQSIVKDSSWSILAKKKVGKMAIFDQNYGLTPLEKCQFFDFLNFLFLQLRKAFFGSRISLKTFSWPILPKKKVGKEAIFKQKPRVNPFGKMSIFRLFELHVFIAQKGVFWFQNILKDIFLAYIAEKKSQKSGHFWAKTMG